MQRIRRGIERKTAFCAVLTVGAFAVGSVEGEIIFDFDNPESVTIAEIQADPDGSFRVGDKVFSDFQVVTGASTNVTAPDASTISVLGTNSFANFDGVLGLEFFGGWATSVGEVINTTITYTVTVDAPFAIESVGLLMSAFATRGDGLVQISENVTNDEAPPDELIMESLLVQDPEVDGLVSNYDQRDIDDEFGPQTQIFITKDITVRDGGTLAGSEPGLAHLSAFSQGYFQIPEPALLSALAIGAPLLMRRRSRGA